MVGVSITRRLYWIFNLDGYLRNLTSINVIFWSPHRKSETFIIMIIAVNPWHNIRIEGERTNEDIYDDLKMKKTLKLKAASWEDIKFRF